MTSRTKRMVVGAAVLAIVGAAAGGAVAANSEDDEVVTGPDADRAVAAALVATNGGTANSVERDSEDGATWEVEVTRPDGSTVDVRLDEAFGVVVVEGDAEDDPADGDSDESETQ